VQKDESFNSWASKHIKDSLQKVDLVHIQDDMAHVTKVSTFNDDAALQMVGQKRWVMYSFEITMKVKGEVCIVEGMEILLNHDLEGMLKIPNVSCGKLDNLEPHVSISQSCIASLMQSTIVFVALKALLLLVIQLKLY
jgi:activator of HSP90 ATPase